jgi:hypothetical protein
MTIEKRAKQSRKLSNNDIGGLLDWLFSPISSKGTSSPTSSTSTSNLSSWEQVLHKYAAAQICRVDRGLAVGPGFGAVVSSNAPID